MNNNTTMKAESSMTNPNDTQYRLSKAGRSRFMVAVLVAMSAGMALEALAGEKGWDYTAGIAVLSESVYVGSDETYAAPTPTFRASYDAGALSYFISLPLEGVGVTYQSEQHNVTGGLMLNFGGQRAPDEYSVIGIPVDHSDKTRAFLEGSPEVETPVEIAATLQRPMNIGIVGASLAYHPTTVEYAQGGIDDKVKHGLLASLSYMKQIPVTERLSISGIFSMEFMDDRYAEAWYSVEHETTALDAFQAKAGLRDAEIAIHASYNISERVALSLYGANMVLLGDAEDSPYTVEQNQQTFLAELTYRF